MKKILLLSISLFLANIFSFSQSEYPIYGQTRIDSTLYVRDSVHIKGRMVVEDRLLLMNGIRVYENARFESNARFLGVSRFDGNAIFKGNVRLDSIGNIPNAILNAGTMEFLVVLPNGQMKKGTIEDLGNIFKTIFYEAEKEGGCGDAPLVYSNPVWGNGDNKIFVDYCNRVNVGIGTVSPNYKLEVRGTTYSQRLKIGHLSATEEGLVSVFRSGTGSQNILALGRVLSTSSGSSQEILFTVSSTGAVSIVNKGNQATLDITNGTGKAIIIKKADGSKILQLENDGLLRARRVRVDADEWADYVFKPGYALMSLKEVEKHIKKRGHLPGVPSEKEIKENGIDLGDMQKIQMEKIEEMFLHIIEMEKKIDHLENKVTSLEKENKALKNK